VAEAHLRRVTPINAQRGASFVQFLIDRDGLPRLRSLYETENYEQVYDKPLVSLEREWRASLLP